MVAHDTIEELSKERNIYENIYKGTIKSEFRTLLGLFHHWHGSFFRLIWHQTLIWLAAYMTIQMVYLFVLCDPDITDRYIKQEYEHFCRYCLHFNKNLPIELIVGFFCDNSGWSVVGSILFDTLY